MSALNLPGLQKGQAVETPRGMGVVCSVQDVQGVALATVRLSYGLDMFRADALTPVGGATARETASGRCTAMIDNGRTVQRCKRHGTLVAGWGIVCAAHAKGAK